MSKYQLDNLDRKILKKLSANARRPFLEIARECNVSGAAIHQRVQKLTAAGVLRGFESLIAPEAMGHDVQRYTKQGDPTRLPQVHAGREG